MDQFILDSDLSKRCIQKASFLWKFLALFWVAFLIPHCAGGEELDATQDVSATEGLPSSLVQQVVCAISGEYTDSSVDVVIPGPEPLTLRRCYGNLSNEGWSYDHGEMVFLIDSFMNGKKVWGLKLKQPTGAHLDYYHPIPKDPKKVQKLRFGLVMPKGLTNGANTISGRTNIKNQKVRYYPQEEKVTVTSAAGDKTTLVFAGKSDNGNPAYRVNELEKINGSLYSYTFNEKDPSIISGIICKNKKSNQSFSAITMKEKDMTRTLTTSDGRELLYEFQWHKYKIKNKSPGFTSIEKNNIFYLKKVSHPYAPEESYDYAEKALNKKLQIVRKSLPDNRFLMIEYYHKEKNNVGGPIGEVSLEKEDFRLDRVKKLKAPVGKTKDPKTIQRFDYHCNTKKNSNGQKELADGYTDVYDALDHRIRYVYDENHRLQTIQRYTGTSTYHLYSKERYIWGDQGTSNEGNLVGRILQDHEGKVHYARYFTYDDRGNVITDVLCGHLTGNDTPNVVLQPNGWPIEHGHEGDSKFYTYSDDNLLLSETDSNGKEIRYGYVDGTDHIKSKFIVYENKIRRREFYFYDNNYVLIKKVIDDGSEESYKDLKEVTERHITKITPTETAPFGFPAVVQELCVDGSTKKKIMLKETRNFYTPFGKLEKQEVYDANKHKAYTLEWTYDNHGNVTSETNAMGQESKKTYDANDNLISEESPILGFTIFNTYDFSNRLIRQEEKHSETLSFVTTHTYDYLGRCTSTTNPYGHETKQDFDAFGRPIKTHLPKVLDENGLGVEPIVLKTYDIAGRITSITDPMKRKTTTKYNARGEPTVISYPDETNELFYYNKSGQLIIQKRRDGIATHFKRDFLGRVLKEETYGTDGKLYKTIENTYNSFHLLSTTDAEGIVTTYTYDLAGRLEWTCRENQKTQNVYDSLGRLSEVREWISDDEYRATIKTFDKLDRVIEERLEDAKGILFSLTSYTYDARGNQIEMKNGDQISAIEYNFHNQPIKCTNALKQETHIDYNTSFINSLGQSVLQTTATDPLGYQTIDTYDAANRLVATARKNPYGTLVFFQEIFYDLSGNACRVVDHKIIDGQTQDTIERITHYNLNNQVVALYEASGKAEQKVTKTTYDSLGRKFETIKNDGVRLTSTYDALSRLKTFKSSDGTIDYLYEYNKKDQPTLVIDERSGQATKRHYNGLGQMDVETLGHGLAMHYTYDRLGRPTSLTLPDQTAIEYCYDAIDLKEIHRKIDSKRVFTHTNKSHNFAGQVTHACLSNQSEVDYTYDLLNRNTGIETDQFRQTVPDEGFDLAGNLRLFCTGDTPYTCDYDDLYHIKGENGHVSHTYRFDSLSNRIARDGEAYTHNALHHLKQTAREFFLYDLNGNMIKREENGSEVLYDYDALDRLIRVTKNGLVTSYAYDPFNRRLSKAGDQLFLYQGDHEIGMWAQGKLQELRLLGDHQRSPTLAIELRGELFVPIQDLMGNIVCLQNRSQEVVERYRYTIFGEREILSSAGHVMTSSALGNPWQYGGKRVDEESGLVAFGLRYYDPKLGRWITPDPAGFMDGPNLYAYVRNNPIRYFDEFGLNAYSTTFDFCLNVFPHPLNVPFALLNPSANPVRFVPFEWLFLSHQTQEQHLNSLSIADDDLPLPWYKEKASYQSLNDLNLLNPETNQPYVFQNRPGIAFGFVNGIDNDLECLKDSMLHIGLLADNNVCGIHAPTFGPLTDGVRYVAGRFGIATETVQEIHKFWDGFFKESPNGHICWTCHSRGAVDTKNALVSYPQQLRERISVIAVAPGCFIDKHLCERVVHFVCKYDPVPRLDPIGRFRCWDTIQFLPGGSHSFKSGVYRTDLQDQYKLFNRKHGK